MTLMFWMFWWTLATLVYIYAGYPLVVWWLARLFGREPSRRPITPTVSLLIPAFNEEAHIEQKLRNSLALDYPKDKLEIVVASDGSTDQTNAIVEEYRAQGVTLRALSRNIGKAAMLSRVVPQLTGELIVFSDASSTLEADALRQLIRNFSDARVGCVCGLYRLRGADDLRGEGEGLYWRYETSIKRQESRLHSILGAHGAFYGIRKALFQPLDGTTINDDYLIPMRIVAEGFRAVYEPRAVAWEHETTSVEGEFARRRRIAAGNCQQIIRLLHLLNPLRRSLDSPDRFERGARSGCRPSRWITGAHWVAFTFFSHKVLRTLAPLFMLALLVSSVWLPSPWWKVALALQALLYGSAWVGYLCQRSGRRITWLSPPLYFCLGNLAMLSGLLKFCFSRHTLGWERAR